MGLTQEDISRLGDVAKQRVNSTLGKGDTTSEAEFKSQLAYYGIGGYERDYPRRKDGQRWANPIENRKWECDFAWVKCLPWTAVRVGRVGDPASLGVFIDGQAHGQRGTGKIRGDGLRAEKPGQRTSDYERINVLNHVMGPLGWTFWVFSPQQVGSLVAVKSIQAWLSGDQDAVLLALQGKG